MEKHKILCVDDEIDNVEALERLFRGKYTVLKATSGKQGLDILNQNPGPIALIITDQRMPEMNGVDFLSVTLQSHPESVRMLLTGYTDIESIITAVNSGQIYRYITKPWDPIDLVNTVDRAVERFVLSQELKVKNSALEKALIELRVLDQAKSQFMILINHELKTPLTTIISFADLLAETVVNDEQQLAVNRIRSSSERLKKIIDDVLIITKAELGTLENKIQSVDVTHLFKQLVDQISAQTQKEMQKKNITLQTSPSDKKVFADSRWIIESLNRLINNAVKYGNENSVITVGTASSQNHRMIFSVFNEGAGIKKEISDQILKPFFIDENYLNHSVGMGLGLTICQSLLKVHSSHLKVENKGNGVEFSFELASP